MTSFRRSLQTILRINLDGIVFGCQYKSKDCPVGTVLAFYVNSRLLVAQILVDGLGAQLTGTHSQDDGGSTGNGIAAGIHALT